MAEAAPSAKVEEWHHTNGAYLDDWVESRGLVHYSDRDMFFDQIRTVTAKKKTLVGDDILAAPPPKDKHIKCLLFPTGITPLSKSVQWDRLISVWTCL